MGSDHFWMNISHTIIFKLFFLAKYAYFTPQGGWVTPHPLPNLPPNLSTDVYLIFLSFFLNVSNIGGSLIKKDLQGNNAVIV